MGVCVFRLPCVLYGSRAGGPGVVGGPVYDRAERKAMFYALCDGLARGSCIVGDGVVLRLGTILEVVWLCSDRKSRMLCIGLLVGILKRFPKLFNVKHWDGVGFLFTFSPVEWGVFVRGLFTLNYAAVVKKVPLVSVKVGFPRSRDPDFSVFFPFDHPLLGIISCLGYCFP